MRIEFARPYILLLIPVIIAGLFLSMRFLHTVDARRRLKQTVVRSLLFTLLFLAMSGVSLRFDDTKVATVFVIDASDSLKNNRSEITSFVNEAIAKKSKKDYVGVVSFGKYAGVENVLSTETSFTGISSDIDTSATNIEDAVTLALAMIPEGYSKRLVIISDGYENAGSLTGTANTVALSGCSLLAWSPESNSFGEEVYISNLSVPESCGVDEDFNIRVEIKSNVSTKAVVSLYLGRELRGRQEVNLTRGDNSLIFKDRQSDTGLKSYQVTIEPEKDTFTVNNEYSAYTNISRKNPILIIESRPQEADTFCKLLDNIKTPYQRVTPDYAPATLSELLNYDAVVFVNVSLTNINRGFLDNIEAYVSDYGKGFVVCGGKQAYALGGYKDSVIEKILPVDMDVKGEKEIPKMAIQLVIDKSGSMSGTNLTQAKQAAIAAVEAMRDTDSIGVMSFDDTYSKVVPICNLNDRAGINKAINSIQIEGGTSIYPALQEAVKDLAKADAAIKHIILLTDGQDGFEIPKYSSVLSLANNESITISTVAIGEGCNTRLLQHIADSCNGRMYEANEHTDVPQIFTQEVYLSANTYIVNEEFTPYISTTGGKSDDLLSGVDGDGLPSLYGYIATTLKNGLAKEVLSSHKDDPVLAWTQYGLGKTVAWTSDVTAQWSGNFFGWSSGNSALWHNIIGFVTQDVRVEGSFAEVESTSEGAKIIYHSGDEFSANTVVSATVFDEDGNSSVIALPATAPGIFEGSFDMTTAGVYSIAVNQYDGDEIVGGLTTAAIKKYSMEYAFDFTKSKYGLIDKYVTMTGGSTISAPSEVFSSKLKSVKAMKDITTLLLVMSLLLFVFDIAYRRFNLHLSDKLNRIFAKIVNVRGMKTAQKPVASSADATFQADFKETSGEAAKPAGETETTPVAKKKAPSEAKKATKKAPEKEPETLDPSQLLNRLKK